MQWGGCARNMCLLAGLLTFLPEDARGQFGGGEPPAPFAAPARACPGPAVEVGAVVEIADEPRSIDPASLLPEALAARATVQFKEAPLTEVVQWLRQERKRNVHLDVIALSDNGLPLTEPVTDQLRDEPVYLLLDRLRSMGCGWRLQGDVVVVTTLSMAGETSYSQFYDLEEFCDRGFDLQRLLGLIQILTSGYWEPIDGVGGSVVLLGDVAAVRQTFQVHREIQAILQGLRQPARRTMLLEPPQHAAWQKKLQRPISVSFQETPLRAAIAELSRLSGGESLIDQQALLDEGVDGSVPVSLQMDDQPWTLVLERLLKPHGLVWQRVDGRLRIIQGTACRVESMSAAVFDVRDLCRDDMESFALAQLLSEQTDGLWTDIDGTGGEMTFPRPGILVVRQTKAVLDEILDLLEAYRTVRKHSPLRPDEPLWRDVVQTRYDRLPTPMAAALALQLPSLVPADNWRTEQQPSAVGTIQVVPSTPGLVDAYGREVVNKSDSKSPQPAMMVDYSILVVQQTRKVHTDIAGVLKRLQSGDPLEVSPFPVGTPTFGRLFFNPSP